MPIPRSKIEGFVFDCKIPKSELKTAIKTTKDQFEDYMVSPWLMSVERLAVLSEYCGISFDRMMWAALSDMHAMSKTAAGAIAAATIRRKKVDI